MKCQCTVLSPTSGTELLEWTGRPKDVPRLCDVFKDSHIAPGNEEEKSEHRSCVDSQLRGGRRESEQGCVW